MVCIPKVSGYYGHVKSASDSLTDAS